MCNYVKAKKNEVDEPCVGDAVAGGKTDVDLGGGALFHF